MLFLSTLSLRRATKEEESSCKSSSISIHALLAESDNCYIIFAQSITNISIHALLAESDMEHLDCKHTKGISIHALLAESDAIYLAMSGTTFHFYPRSPCGERQAVPGKNGCILHFYPRSPCGERLGNAYVIANNNDISIHALLAESDDGSHHGGIDTVHISIHALLAESDPITMTLILTGLLFLSTLSLRRATSPPSISSMILTHFYPRSPCGERRFCLGAKADSPTFLSTLSLRRATRRG